MSVFNYIKNLAKEHDHLSLEEQSNLAQLSFYKIMKEAPYFKDRYHLFRLASVKYNEPHFFEDETPYQANEDETFNFSRSIGLGFKELDNLSAKKYNDHPEWLFDNYANDFDFKFTITDKDQEILKKALKLVEKSENFYDFIGYGKTLIEENPEILHQLNYLMQHIFKNDNLFNLSKSFLLEEQKSLYKTPLEIKYKSKFGLNFSLRDTFDFLDYSDREMINWDYSDLKQSLNKEDQKEIDLALEGHPLAQKNIKYILLYSELPKIELIDKLVFKKAKLMTNKILKNLLNSKNENEYIIPLNKEINSILEKTYKKFPLLNNDSKFETECTYIKKGSNRSLDVSDLPFENWTLDDFDIDKAFIDGFNNFTLDEISYTKTYNSDYFISNNDLEHTCVVKTTDIQDKHLRLCSISGIDDLTNKENVKKLLKYTFDTLEDKKIKSLVLDFEGASKDPNETIFTNSLREVINENDYSFFIYGDNNNKTFPPKFNSTFRQIVELPYREFPYNSNKDIKQLKKLHKNMLEYYNTLDVEKFDRQSWSALNDAMKDKFAKEINKLSDKKQIKRGL